MKRGLYIGRFQPFQKGHLRVIKKALEEVDELIIIIGSSDKSFNELNPLTAGERIEIIKGTLMDEGIENRYYLLPIPDIQINAVWVSHVEMNVPKFDIVYSGADITKTLFEQKGYETKELIRWNDISASEVRRRILEDDNWSELIPQKTFEILQNMGFTERVRQIMTNEK